MKNIAITLTLASALAVAGCSKKAPEQLPPTPHDAVEQPQASGPTPGSPAHFASVMRGADTIFCDTDTHGIDAEDEAALCQQADYLRQYPTIRATIEGHCDERGTREYNIALGERRANAARNYLVSLGISADRLTTVSYGKERPVAVGSNENAWAQNRRAVTIIIG